MGEMIIPDHTLWRMWSITAITKRDMSRDTNNALRWKRKLESQETSYSPNVVDEKMSWNANKVPKNKDKTWNLWDSKFC